VITQDKNGGYTIQVLDLPEAISHGNTIEEAVLYGQEALALAIESRVDEGEAVPAPTPLSEAHKLLDDYQQKHLVEIREISADEC